MNSKRKSQCKRQVLSGPLLHFWFCTMTIVSFLEWEKEQKAIFTGEQLGEIVFEKATICIFTFMHVYFLLFNKFLVKVR